MHHPHIPIPPGAVTGIGSLPMDDPHVAVQFVEHECPLIPFWPELPRRSPEARSVEQTFGPFADLLRPRLDSYGYEVVPRQLGALLERLEQAPTRLEPTRSAGFFLRRPCRAVLSTCWRQGGLRAGAYFACTRRDRSR